LPSRSSRRGFLHQAAALCIPATPLVGLVPDQLSVTELLRELDQLSHRLATAAIDPDSWQTGAEALLARVAAKDLLAALSIDWSTLRRETRRAGQVTHRLAPTELHGCPATPVFRPKLFAFARNHAIVPHAHHNLVSAFLVLAGRFHGRHFDRVSEDAEAIVIRPTDDRPFEPGDAAAISDQRDNVHWFTALDDDALLFNLSVTIPESLRDPRVSSTGRIYLDPDGERLDAGLIRAPRASLSLLRAKYDG
jgi:hypothetical protein